MPINYYVRVFQWWIWYWKAYFSTDSKWQATSFGKKSKNVITELVCTQNHFPSFHRKVNIFFVRRQFYHQCKPIINSHEIDAIQLSRNTTDRILFPKDQLALFFAHKLKHTHTHIYTSRYINGYQKTRIHMAKLNILWKNGICSGNKK